MLVLFKLRKRSVPPETFAVVEAAYRSFTPVRVCAAVPAASVLVPPPANEEASEPVNAANPVLP